MFRFIVLTALVAYVSAGLLPAQDGRIVGGRDATIEEYPHQVSLRKSGSHFCGGSLYKENVIVTAAHCVKGVSASTVTVVAGTTSRTGEGELRSVKAIHVHPSYSSLTTKNDVAVLILSSPFTYSASIQPIALASIVPPAGTEVDVSGWGVVKEGGSAPATLQVVTVSLVSNSDCVKSYSSLSISASMLCAGVDGGGKDACQGDSGGPLVQGGKLLGIVSWGRGCARKGYPGVYSNVPYLKSWIEENS